MKGDSVAAKRLEIKSGAKGARRAIRYQRFTRGKSLMAATTGGKRE